MSYLLSTMNIVTTIIFSVTILFSTPSFALNEASTANLSSKPHIQANEVNLFNNKAKRPVKLDLWYKSKDCKLTNCAVSENQPLNIAIISHGAMGSAKDYSWLAYPLASQNWLVIGLNHFGESWRYGKQNIDPSSVQRFWQRTEDTSFVINELDNILPDHLTTDNRNITVIGHSSGGYTAAALAGVTLNFKQMQHYCKSIKANNDLGCSYGDSRHENKTTNVTSQQLTPNSVSGFDKRVSRIVMLDPALGPASTITSMNKVKVPALIVGSKDNDFLPFKYHAQYYSKHIPTSALITLNHNEGHFVYLNTCEHNFKAKGVALCRDREGVNRKQVHQQLLNQIFKFLLQTT